MRLMNQSSGRFHETVIKPLTPTQYCGRRVDGEESYDSYIKKNIGQNASPTDSLFQDYDYDIAMSSGGNGSPMLEFAHGVVAPQDGHSK